MCTVVGIKIGGDIIECDTIGQLKTAICGEVIHDDDECDDNCLCNVQLQKTATINKMTCRLATSEEGHPFPEFIMEKI